MTYSDRFGVWVLVTEGFEQMMFQILHSTLAYTFVNLVVFL